MSYHLHVVPSTPASNRNSYLPPSCLFLFGFVLCFFPGDGRHFVFGCPHFAHIRRQFRSLYQDADGTMQCFVWHKDQTAVCHCLAAILNVADDSNKDASS